jgi:hypothetical protein
MMADGRWQMADGIRHMAYACLAAAALQGRSSKLDTPLHPIDSRPWRYDVVEQSRDSRERGK